MTNAKMATRPFFAASVKTDCAYFEEEVTFEWHSGLSWQQRQRSSDSMAQAILSKYPIPQPELLEVSTASRSYDLGRALSALNLLYEDKESGQVHSLENWFQASKVFEKDGCVHGPYLELLTVEKPARYVNAFLDKKIRQQYANDALFQKIQSKLEGSSLAGFRLHGEDYPLVPRSAFYDYLYVSALSQRRNAALAAELCKYRVFTDIMFTPGSGKRRKYNTQARSCAIFASLSKRGLLQEALDSFADFVSLVGYKDEEAQVQASATEEQLTLGI